VRIIRHPILHQGTFEKIVKFARHASRDRHPAGQSWRLVSNEEGVQIYRPMDPDLAWLRNRVDTYEQYLYRSLAGGYCGRDGILRPRTRDMLREAGGFRQVFSRTDHI
jgi:hypothetical protein